tara:strand:+ start:18550 stop:18960 length:411 start_codon:yes stop_codon:yes gene_type:complete
MVEGIRKHFKKEYTSKFDIDLDFGESYEYALGQILNMGKIEIKTERDKWVKTGNIAIELKNQGNPSGLSVTEAEWWAQILSFKGDIKSVILISVKELKKKVKHSVKHGNGRIVMGGDDNASEIALIPIKEIHEKKS